MGFHRYTISSFMKYFSLLAISPPRFKLTEMTKLPQLNLTNLPTMAISGTFSLLIWVGTGEYVLKNMEKLKQECICEYTLIWKIFFFLMDRSYWSDHILTYEFIPTKWVSWNLKHQNPRNPNTSQLFRRIKKRNILVLLVCTNKKIIPQTWLQYI